MLSQIVWEIKERDEELHNSALRIEELETVISSIALESQCEIESMKLDIAALEERCFAAERLSEQAAQEKAKMDLLLEMSESQFQDSQERISNLEMETKYLKQKLVVSADNADGSYCKVMEHLHNCVKHNSNMNVQGPGRCFPDLLVELKKELHLSKVTSKCEEVSCPFDSNPAVMTALDDNVKEMSNQICEFELQVLKLQEELRIEKLKAKEEGEDLTQAMAELRYQMTDMLEEECKRRASVEETSLRRIQDLEEQVRKEQNKYFTAMRRFQEAHKLAERRVVEIRHLKKALEGFRKITDPETARTIESCNCENCTIACNSYKCSTEDTRDAEALDGDFCNGDRGHEALIEWYPDSKDPSIGAE